VIKNLGVFGPINGHQQCQLTENFGPSKTGYSLLNSPKSSTC